MPALGSHDLAQVAERIRDDLGRFALLRRKAIMRCPISSKTSHSSPALSATGGVSD